MLGRTLSAIAQSQYYGDAHPVLKTTDSPLSVTSGDTQTLLVQNELSGKDPAIVTYGIHSLTAASGKDALAWTSTLAEQSLQNVVEADLIRKVSGGAQAAPETIQLHAGDAISVTAEGAGLALYQEKLTNEFGFVNFGDANGSVVLARPVAIAQNVGGLSNQDAVIHLRHVGAEPLDSHTHGDNLSLELFRVDDLSGAIARTDGTRAKPGDADYAALAAARDFTTITGQKIIHAPDFAQLSTPIIQHVGQGDIIAMKLTNESSGKTFWSFADETARTTPDTFQTHLWSYGLNTWGWNANASWSGSDHSFTDLIVGVDFTSLGGDQANDPLLADCAPNTYSVSTDVFGANAVHTYLLYQAAFNRTADRAGLNFWTGALATGAYDAQALAKIMVTSQDYVNAYGVNIDDATFLTELHTFSLGRAPDAAGAKYWSDQLHSGLSRADVILAFTGGQEMINDYANHMTNGFWVT